MPHLHILNGDSALPIFEASKIEGQVMICREILVEGKTHSDLGSKAFVANRLEFFKLFFDEADSLYQEKFLSELAKLKQAKTYDEITLWFEYDLFCQINMVAMLSYLKQLEIENISLVCIGLLEGYEKMVGLGEITATEYSKCFKNRIKLETEDLEFAQEFWNIYCSSDHRPLIRLVQRTPKAFPYLNQSVVEAHYSRFPALKTGLNEIERTMLKLIKDKNLDQRGLIGAMLKLENWYGFGDWQYEMYLNNLSPLIEKGDKLQLNKTGEAVLSGKQSFLELSQHEYFFGGSSNSAYEYNVRTQSLQKV